MEIMQDLYYPFLSLKFPFLALGKALAARGILPFRPFIDNDRSAGPAQHNYVDVNMVQPIVWHIEGSQGAAVVVIHLGGLGRL